MFNVITMSVTAPILHFQKSIVGQFTGRNYFSLNLFLDLSEFFFVKSFSKIFLSRFKYFFYLTRNFFHIFFLSLFYDETEASSRHFLDPVIVISLLASVC
jgi:hypothetical protein